MASSRVSVVSLKDNGSAGMPSTTGIRAHIDPLDERLEDACLLGQQSFIPDWGQAAAAPRCSLPRGLAVGSDRGGECAASRQA
jgi:hypothetical protein